MNEPNFFVSLILSVLTAVISQNFVFARSFGVSTAISAARNKRDLPGICLGVSFFTPVCAVLAYFLSAGSTNAENKAFIPLIYAAVIGMLYMITLLLSVIVFGTKFKRIKKYVHISAFNSVVMGTIFFSTASCKTMGEFLLFGLCAGAGFTVSAFILSGVYHQLYSDKVPSAFRGYPAVMVFCGIIAMTLYGILGHSPTYL